LIFRSDTVGVRLLGVAGVTFLISCSISSGNWNRLDGTPQFRSELLGDVVGVGSVADDLGANEDDQFGSRGRPVVVGE
jgi:hypothetical protein